MSGSMTCKKKPAGGSGGVVIQKQPDNTKNGSGSISTGCTGNGSGSVTTTPPKKPVRLPAQEQRQSDGYTQGQDLRQFFAQYGINLP